MIPPERYESLGELLRDALVQFKTETALIETNRKREALRYSYLELQREVLCFARHLQDIGIGAGDQVAICMQNQSRWIIAGAAAFYRGAIIVPLDYKLSAKEQEALIAHCQPSVLVTEWPVFMKLDLGDDAATGLRAQHVIVSDAPARKDVGRALRFADVMEASRKKTESERPDFVARKRSDQATLVYSSGTGGTPKGCMLSHDNYLEQYRSLSAVFALTEGKRYFSILPTNHAIDFMCGFVGPLAGGATVVHQRSLRPEFIGWTMERYGITHMAIVPLLLEAFERRIDERLEAQSEAKRHLFQGLRTLNASLTLKTPRAALSRMLLKPVHDSFGGALEMLFCGGAFVDRERAQFFYDLGLPVVIGYGLTEAGTVLTVNDLRPFRADTVGRPLGGVELEIRDRDLLTGVGEVWAKSRTVMMGYLDEPELTAEAIQDGWLKTGDLGRLDPSGHLHLVGRSKNMIVTAGGKNVYPEDIESAFEGTPCEELVVFATGYVWPDTGKARDGGQLSGEGLFAVVRERTEEDEGGPVLTLGDAIARRNRKLPEHKRISGVLRWNDAFPRTASMKVKRSVLAAQLRERLEREALEPVGA